MGIGSQALFRFANTDAIEQFAHAGTFRCLVHAAVDPKRLANLLENGLKRIERGHRLLEDDRDAATANCPHLVLLQREEISTVEIDFARGMRGGWIGQQAQDR